MSAAEPRRPPRRVAPLQRRRVQMSVAACASVALIALLMPAPNRPAARGTTGLRGSEVPSARPAQLKIDLNRAGAQEIALLPGVGPVLAGRILRHRDRHGRFESLAALDRVRGIGPKTIAALAPLCVLGGPRDHEPAGRVETYVTNVPAPHDPTAPPASPGRSPSGAASTSVCR